MEAHANTVQFAGDYRLDGIILHNHQNEGIDVNKATSDGATPLLIACQTGKVSIAAMLLKHPNIDINKYDKWNVTPLNMASSKNFHEIIKLILEHPTSDVNFVNEAGRSPISIAAWNGHDDSVALLLHDPRVEINTTGHNGGVLFDAVSNPSRLSTLNLLLSSERIDPNLAETLHGGTPLIVASQRGFTAIALALMQDPRVTNATSHSGTTALETAKMGATVDLSGMMSQQYLLQ